MSGRSFDAFSTTIDSIAGCLFQQLIVSRRLWARSNWFYVITACTANRPNENSSARIVEFIFEPSDKTRPINSSGRVQ